VRRERGKDKESYGKPTSNICGRKRRRRSCAK
jgi:hypothetical protein